MSLGSQGGLSEGIESDGASPSTPAANASSNLNEDAFYGFLIQLSYLVSMRHGNLKFKMIFLFLLGLLPYEIA